MNPDFDHIKKTTDIVRVVESYGVALKKVGADHVGLCPFHEDKKPSLHVTQGKGLFHCPACGAAGNAIQFVAKKEGISDREAALKLCAAIPGVSRGSDIAAP
jgi:DNA primase